MSYALAWILFGLPIAIAFGLMAWAERRVHLEVRREEMERRRIVRNQQEAWRAANPELAAQGVPPPPTPESMTEIGTWFGGGFIRYDDR